MRLAHIADVDEGVEGVRGDGRLGAVDEAVDVGGRGVEAVEGFDVVRGGAVHHGRTDGGEREVGLLLGDVIPGCLFGEGLRGAVCDSAVCGVFCGFLVCHGIPVCFGVCVLWPVPFRAIPDAGEGGG